MQLLPCLVYGLLGDVSLPLAQLIDQSINIRLLRLPHDDFLRQWEILYVPVPCGIHGRLRNDRLGHYVRAGHLHLRMPIDSCRLLCSCLGCVPLQTADVNLRCAGTVHERPLLGVVAESAPLAQRAAGEAAALAQVVVGNLQARTPHLPVKPLLPHHMRLKSLLVPDLVAIPLLM